MEGSMDNSPVYLNLTKPNRLYTFFIMKGNLLELLFCLGVLYGCVVVYNMFNLLPLLL